MDLSEDDVALWAIERAPSTDAPLQCPADAAIKLWMAPQHLLEHRNWAQPRGTLQQRHHLAVEDVDQWVWAAPATWRLGWR